MDACREGTDRCFKRAGSFESHLIDGIKEEPGISGAAEPPFKSLWRANFEGRAKRLIYILDADEKSGSAARGYPRRLSLELEGFSRPRVRENDAAIEIS